MELVARIGLLMVALTIAACGGGGGGGGSGLGMTSNPPGIEE